MKNNELVYIGVECIFPHPDNPRKDVGDVTELADSIKACGVMQNLTVVPKDKDTYTVIIGHRRLAASKKAGLERVPCVVADMDKKEQISTMLLENMQRSDLTVYEQAQGFQMMMDFGESVESISEKTGFSQSTVRRRVKLLNLNSDKFCAAEQRGGTMEDYLKVAEIKNEKVRNKVTDSIGTSNFSWELRRALEKQTLEEKLPLIKKLMKKHGVEKNESLYGYESGYERILYEDIKEFDEERISKMFDDGKVYFWKIASDTHLLIFVKLPKTKKEKPMKSKKEIRVEEQNRKLKEITERAYELRKEFLSNFTSGKKYSDVINKWMWAIFCNKLTGGYSHIGWELLDEKIGEEYSKNQWKCNRESLEKYLNETPDNAYVVTLAALCGDSRTEGYYYTGYGESMPTYQKNADLDFIYEWICKLGYEMSDEEKALQNGTHELFASKKEKKQ